MSEVGASSSTSAIRRNLQFKSRTFVIFGGLINDSDCAALFGSRHRRLFCQRAEIKRQDRSLIPRQYGLPSVNDIAAMKLVWPYDRVCSLLDEQVLFMHNWEERTIEWGGESIACLDIHTRLFNPSLITPADNFKKSKIVSQREMRRKIRDWYSWIITDMWYACSMAPREK